MYISLDLETSGLSSKNDKIIEIGAVKFNDDKITDTFRTCINIGQPLAPIITHITGITDDDLTGAPTLEEVKDNLIDFIGDLPIVGHNISFDIDFLQTNSIFLENDVYDTLQLSAILLPGLPSYSLEMITGKFGIRHTNKHRALDDAIACAKLFQMLCGKILEIEPQYLEEIKSLAAKSNWALKEVFLSRKSSKTTSDKDKADHLPDFNENIIPLKFDRDEILSLYKKNGSISKYENDYEVRDPQIRMTNKIIDAYENSSSLLCEAGTGTGKTIAYLLPSVFLAKAKNTRVVIATHTKNLQDQLYEKDIPVIKKALADHLKIDEKDSPFNTAVLKGRKNYLSVERLNEFKKKTFFLDHEITMLLKIILWLPKTKSGDSEELALQGKEYYAWNDVCCDHIKCPHSNHAFASKCFLAKAREKAQNSSIIITNHALLLHDTIMPAQVLPEHKYLVIDEAHNLETEATKALTITITQQLLESSLLNLRSLAKKQADLLYKTETLIHKTEILFGLLGIFFEKNIHYANSIQNLMLHENFYGTFEWQKVSESAENVYLLGMNLVKDMHNAADDNDEDDEINKKILFECETLTFHLKNINKTILDTAEKPTEEYITWIFKSYAGAPGINSTMLHVGEHLKNTLYHEKESVIMTSATLTTENNFDYFKKQLSLDESFDSCIIPSHFSYRDQAQLVIYKNLSQPASPGFFNQTAEIIFNTAMENKGKMLVLFTSKNAIEATYLKLASKLKEKDITILAQNVSGGRNKILELFKRDPENSVIFGTSSFWEGIDIKGTSLSCVVIQKLPFDPPDDPIHKSRSNMHDDPFNDYQIPRAILKFKQGFGRLIRSAKDHGKVIILDSRIVNKGYGDAFIRSLPDGIGVIMEEYNGSSY